MTNPSAAIPKLLGLLLTLAAIAERGSLTHIDTIILAAGAVLFLMLMEAQQRAGAGDSWRLAGQWLKALLGPAVLPFYALLFGALIVAPQGPPPVHAQPPLNVPVTPSPYPYMSQRQPGMPGGQGMMPGAAGNPGALPRPATGFGPPSARSFPSNARQPSTSNGSPSFQRPQVIQRPPSVNGTPVSPPPPPVTPGATSAVPAPSPTPVAPPVAPSPPK